MSFGSNTYKPIQDCSTLDHLQGHYQVCEATKSYNRKRSGPTIWMSKQSRSMLRGSC